MARKTMWGFIRDQWTKVPPVVKTDLSGKTVVVVGANVGLGFEAAKHFASMNPQRLVLACRSKEKGEAAVAELGTKTGYKNAELWLVDLGDFSSVRAFADRFEKDGGRLDILVQNAGVASFDYKSTVDGYETTIQVNDLSSALVSLLLLPRMLETATKFAVKPRLVIVSSDVHYWSKIPKSVLQTPNIFRTLGSKEFSTKKAMGDRYFVSKLLNVLFVRALDAHLAPTSPIIVSAVNPGFCYSSIRRDFKGFMAIVDKIMEITVAWTTEQGSRQLVWAAIGGDPDQVRGGYVSIANVVEPSDYVVGKEGRKLQDRAWTDLVDILVKVDPRVKETIDKFLIADA